MARRIKITPPEISRYLDGRFFKKFPLQKPITDNKNDATPTNVTDNKRFV